MTVGSDPDCGIHIDSLALEPEHALLSLNDHGLAISDLSGQGLIFEKQSIPRHQFKNGDEIQIGKHTLLYKYSNEESEILEARAEQEELIKSLGSPASKTPEPDAWLQIMNGDNVGKAVNLTRKMMTLGKHGVQSATIAHRSDGFYISHMEGKRPTTINQKPIGEHSHRLNPGDIIQIGNVKLMFSISE